MNQSLNLVAVVTFKDKHFVEALSYQQSRQLQWKRCFCDDIGLTKATAQLLRQSILLSADFMICHHV